MSPSCSEEHAPASGRHPFQCSVCDKRFTRHENLKRHLSVHTEAEPTSLQCPHCPTTFSRNDLRKRHIQRKHARKDEDDLVDLGLPPPTDDIFAHEGMFDGDPQLMSPSLSVASSDPPRYTGQSGFYLDATPQVPRTGATLSFDPSASLSPVESLPDITAPEIALGLDLYFANVSHFFPFVHRPTFDGAAQLQPKPLLLVMVALGLQYSDTSDARVAARCFHLACNLLERDTSSMIPLVEVVQAHILLAVYAIMYTCGRDTAIGLQLHAKSVTLARQGKVFEPLPTQPKGTADLDSLWRAFVRAESNKRTCYALYLIDSILYHLLSIPRAVSHLEIRHEIPCSDNLWSQSTATGWAHASLTDDSGPSPRYITAVRGYLSNSAEAGAVSSSLNAYALTLVHSFVLSSVRESSGWSTMTGQVCFERFGALQSAGNVLEPEVMARAGDGQHSVLAEAMLRASLVELLMWAPSHTSGVVETSLDSAIASAAHLAATQPASIAADVMESLEPHLSWFLGYLDQPLEAAREPPWVTAYAFRAVLCAWQLAKEGSFQPLAHLGIADLDDLVLWSKRVFARRARWEVGRLIVKNLEHLELSYSTD